MHCNIINTRKVGIWTLFDAPRPPTSSAVIPLFPCRVHHFPYICEPPPSNPKALISLTPTPWLWGWALHLHVGESKARTGEIVSLSLGIFTTSYLCSLSHPPCWSPGPLKAMLSVHLPPCCRSVIRKKCHEWFHHLLWITQILNHHGWPLLGGFALELGGKPLVTGRGRRPGQRLPPAITPAEAREHRAATDISVYELWTLAAGRKIEPAPKLGGNEGDVSRSVGLLRQV